MGAVARILERILGVLKHLVQVLGIAGSGTANVVIPCAHGPTSGIVGVQRDGLGLLLDGLQVGDELIRGGRQLVDAGVLEDLLVVDDAGGVAGGSDAIDLVVVGFVGGVLDFLLHVVEGAVRQEVVAQLGLINGRDHHDVAPVATLQTGQRAVGVISAAFDGDLDVRIHLVELSEVLLPGRAAVVVLEHIGTVAVQLQIGLDVLAGLAKGDVLVLEIRGLRGAVAAAASSHAHHAGGCDAGCDNLLEIHLLILPYESLFITSGDSAPILRW